MLEYTLGGRNIAEVLAMSVAGAEQYFGDGEERIPAAHKILDRLADVGLGYLTLDQPLTALSGGERQRLKLATRMAEKGGVYVLDEPTGGLHLADVERLLGLLDRLVDSGKSVVVIEHHQAVMAHADRIIDLGPGARHDGGRIVFEGTPADLALGETGRPGQRTLARMGAEGRREALHENSYLLPDGFRRFLEEAYFADFEPGKPATLSRNSVGHGVASQEEFGEKGACLSLLIVHQLFYYLPETEMVEEPASDADGAPARED